MAHSKEHYVTLEYVVRIHTYGKPRQLRKSVGKRLARLCGLNFLAFEVSSGKVKYDWKVTDPDGGVHGEA